AVRALELMAVDDPAVGLNRPKRRELPFRRISRLPATGIDSVYRHPGGLIFRALAAVRIRERVGADVGFVRLRIVANRTGNYVTQVGGAFSIFQEDFSGISSDELSEPTEANIENRLCTGPSRL